MKVLMTMNPSPPTNINTNMTAWPNANQYVLVLTTVWPVTVTAETEVKNAVSMAVNPEPFCAIGRVKRLPPAKISRAKAERRMVVVPNSGRFTLGGSTSATMGDNSRRLRSRIMLSLGLRLNAMFSA